MEKDTLLILFSSLNWLISGLVIYYLLTVVKVHLFRYLPMRLYNYQGTLNRPFKNYFKALFQDSISKLDIYQSSFRYIFKYKESEWRQPEIKQIKIALNILDGFTTFLKPYIILSILWAFFKLWFESHFLYRELQITLFEIQQFNSSLSQYSLLTFLANNSAYVILFYSAVCILIPFFYLKREITNRVKNYFSLLLICLSIITNLSFFGSKAGYRILSEQKEIMDIEFKIAETHNEIYKISATQIIINDFDKEIEGYQNVFDDEQEGFEFIDSSKITLSDNYRSELFHILNRLKENLNSKYSIPSPPAISTNNEYKNPTEGFYKSSTEYFYSENFKQATSSNVKTDNGYFTSKKNWNYEQGQRILSELKKSNEVINEESIPKKKIISWIEACFEFGIDQSLEACIGYFGAENQLVIKEFLGIVLSENYKEPLASRIAIFLSSISNEIGQKLTIPKTTYPIPKLFSRTIIADEFNESKEKFNSSKKEIIKRQEDEIKAKIKEEKLFAKQQAKIKIQQEKEYRADQRLIKENEALSKKIEQRLHTLKFNPNLNQYDEIRTLNSSKIDAHIKNQIISFMTNQGNKSNYEYNNELKLYYEFLKNNGNTSSILNRLAYGSINTNPNLKIGICPCCGLPLVFPKCLCRL